MIQSELFFARHPDPEVRRRGLNVCAIAGGLRDALDELRRSLPHAPNNKPDLYRLPNAEERLKPLDQGQKPLDQQALREMCDACSWNAAAVARQLGVTPQTVYALARRNGINWERCKYVFYASNEGN